MTAVPPDLLLARRELDLERRAAELRRENGILFYTPHAKQIQFHAAANYRRRYARTGNRFGKPLAEHELVILADRVCRIDQVRVGDITFDHEGKPTKITGVFPQGPQQLYRFHFNDNTTVDCCLGHLWRCKGPKQRWKGGDWIVLNTAQIIATSGLEPNPPRRFVIPLTQPVQWPERDLPLDPYLLGALLGDGGMTGSSISFTTWDEELLQSVMRLLPEGSHLRTNQARPGQYWIAGEHENTGAGRISTNTLPAILASLGLHGKDSYNKFIPGVYAMASVEQRLALIQGLFDTDGYVNKEGNNVEYSTCSSMLSQAVVFVVQSLGYTANCVLRHTQDQNGTLCPSYRITIHLPTSELFRLTRKRSLVKLQERGERQRVLQSIEKLQGETPAYCIAVDSPNHTFLTTNFVVTHNSEMGAAEDVAFALGYRPWVPVGDPLRTLGIPTHATKGLIVTTDWDKSTEIFTSTEAGANQGKLLKYIPAASLVEMTKNHSGAIDRVVVKSIHGGNSVIHLDTVKSFKQNPLGQESSAWDWAHFDEPVPEAMWKAIARGLVDRDGHAWFTCTPLTEPWLDGKFIPNLDDQTAADFTGDNASDSDHWWMTGSMHDNPYNSERAITLYISELTEEERETRISGIPAAYSGIVYKEFRPNEHKLKAAPSGWKDWQTPPPEYCLDFAIDYHPRKPHHVLFIATSPLDVHYVYAELWLSCLMSELVSEIKSILHGVEPTRPGLIDPLADTPNRVTDCTPLEEVLRLGLPVIPATKDPHNGILKVKELLKARDRIGLPIMFVNPACKRFLFEISRGYIWDGDTNKPFKENDDAMENFYRLCLQGLSYVPPSSISEYSPVAARSDFSNVVEFDPSREERERKQAFARTRYASGSQFDVGEVIFPSRVG